MAYIIEQKIKGRIYLYKVESYWDKDKKQSRQKRTYIGPKNKKKKTSLKEINGQIAHKNYGNIFLLNFILKRIGLEDILINCFPDYYKEIVALAYYEITEASPYYLFPFWLEEHFLPKTKKMDSPAISRFCDELGRQQRSRIEFHEQWLQQLQPIDALFYDITSISSYSTNIEYVEWGYNRDHENLSQINMGIVFCGKNLLPIFYTLYPGSIVDVKTLKNCMAYLQKYGLKEFMFILDRGFFSTSNIIAMSGQKAGVSFIQPLSFSLKKVKEQIKAHKKELHDIKNNFRIDNELLSHVQSKMQFEDKTFHSHIYLNEKAELDQKQQLIKDLIEIEDKVLKNKHFPNLKEAIKFKTDNIIKKYQELFKWNRVTKMLERNMVKIKERVSSLGYFVLLTNRKQMNRTDILEKYRNKDSVEKVFDLLKNEMDGDRLRAHSQYNSDARLFIKFISLIILSEIIKIMRDKKLFKRYTVKEMLATLRKIKITSFDNEHIISEVTKQQRLIMEAFKIDIANFHSY